MSVDQERAERLRDETRKAHARNGRVPSESDVQPPSDDDTPRDFKRDEDGRIYHSQENIHLALRKLGVRVRYDMFGDRELVDGIDGFGPDLDDAAMNRLRMQIDREFQFRPSKEFFYDVIADHAQDGRFHPVRDYLDALRWDGVPRLDGWLSRYAAAESTEYTRAIGSIVLIAAVRRARKPGCKFDEMLILESKQGTNKSTALSVLAVAPDWFTDDLPLGADTKRQMESTAGKWIVEAGELKGMSRGDIHALKGYMSRQSDEARMAYGRKRKKMLRQFVIIGTTNETADYLKDTTGNRRFWPVRIGKFDIDKLRTDRDQLWAEATVRDAAKESIRLDESLYGAAAIEQEDRRAEDSIEILLADAFDGITGKIAITEAWKILGIDNRPLTTDETARFGAAMRRLGWERVQRRLDGDRCYVYVRGSEVEREKHLVVSIDRGVTGRRATVEGRP